MSFNPAMSGKAHKAVGTQIRAWHLNLRVPGARSSGLTRENTFRSRGAGESDPVGLGLWS